MNLQHAYHRETFLKFVHGFIPGFSPDIRSATATGLQTTKTVVYLGESRAFDLSVFELTHLSTRDARVKLAMDGFRVMKAHSVFRALIVYRSNKSDDWRLSLMTATLASNKKGEVAQTFSNPRRFSFFLGPNAKINTPNKFLVTQGAVNNFEDLQRRFSLEVVNKEFYRSISENYIKLVGGTIGSGSKQKTYEPILRLPSQSLKSPVRMEFGVRLIGRIIFSWFLREKEGQNNIALMPKELVSSEAVRKHKSYYHSVLEPVFFEVLNKEHRVREERWTMEPFSHIPYLNGGLFSPQGDDYYELDRDILISRHLNTLAIPDAWFEEFFNLLESYNFTIDENTSFDEELSIDPEMLGRIFENLLAEINPETGTSARKSTGSFYTPRTIVDYMVDESLFLFLKQTTNIKEAKLRALMSYDLTDDERYPFDDSEKQKIIDALESLKLLDPACGSGAFPIGALQKIVFILQRVDPDAHRWFAKQIANTSPEIRRVIEREFKHKNFDYIRKLGIIRENIYGVDIQPIAIEISRLRCFLTLVVDERVDDSLPNRGIEPLPNLDFKFVAANSLIGLDNEQTATEGLFKDQEGIARLRAMRDRYFNATNSERHRLQNEFSAVQKQMLGRMIQLGGKVASDETTRQLSLWEPFSNRVSSWFDPEWMFGIDKKFDVVIANPPYVKREHLREEDAKQLAHIFTEEIGGETKNWADDLYTHFIFKGFELTKKDGVLTFVTNDSFIGLASKERIRRLMLANDLKQVVKCPAETFEATIYVAVFILQKRISASQTYSTGRFNFPAFDYQYLGEVPYAFIEKLPNKRLVLADPITQIYARLVRAKKVKDYLNVLDTGIDSGNVRVKLFFADNTSGRLDKLIQGRQITRWNVSWDAPGAKYKYCDIHYIPQPIKGIGRGGKMSKHDEGWNFRGDIENHRQPKRLLMRQTDDDLVVAYQNEPQTGRLYTDNTLFTILSKTDEVPLKYAMGILNSRLLNALYHTLSQEEGKTLAQVKVRLVEELPFRVGNQSAIVAVVDKILALSMSEGYLNDETKQKQVAEYEKQIDQLVYNLYGLTPEEIRVVENSDT